jgi:hypothetical protein
MPKLSIPMYLTEAFINKVYAGIVLLNQDFDYICTKQKTLKYI